MLISSGGSLNTIKTEELIEELQKRLPNCKITIETPEKTATCDAQSPIYPQSQLYPAPHDARLLPAWNTMSKSALLNTEPCNTISKPTPLSAKLWNENNPSTFAGQAHPPFGFGTGDITQENTSKS